MYDFKTMSAGDPLLETSPIMRSIDFLAAQFEENPKGIPLTKTKALRRALVADAISSIQWPDWTESEIYNGFMPIKIADEYHFQPFCELRQIMWEMGLFRHYKGHLRLARAGRDLFENRFKSFDAITRNMVFENDHFEYHRLNRGIAGTWDIWLNVIDMEAQSGVSGKELTEVLYGPDPTGNTFDPRTSALYDGVLKPLVWAGLLQENRDLGRKLTERVYTTTPLWHRYLKLDVKKPRLHVVH
jgi:hypothetical protein